MHIVVTGIDDGRAHGVCLHWDGNRCCLTSRLVDVVELAGILEDVLIQEIFDFQHHFLARLLGSVEGVVIGLSTNSTDLNRRLLLQLAIQLYRGFNYSVYWIGVDIGARQRSLVILC